MEMVLKILGLICVTVVAITILITNKDDEDTVFKVICMMIIALIIIFAPLDELKKLF